VLFDNLNLLNNFFSLAAFAFLGVRMLYPIGHPRKVGGQSGNCHRSFLGKYVNTFLCPT